MKLWAFGCSNTYGFSLGTGLDPEQFLKNNKDNIKLKWSNEVLKKQKSASSLAWPAMLAKKFNIEARNLAEPGSGLDKCIIKLNQVSSKIDWTEDIVLIGIPKIYRYTSFDGKNLQLSTKILDGSPSIESLDIYFDSMLLYLKSTYPHIHLIKIYDDGDKSIDSSAYKYIDYTNSNSLKSFDSGRYPCGHFNELTHKKFAEHLYSQLTDK